MVVPETRLDVRPESVAPFDTLHMKTTKTKLSFWFCSILYATRGHRALEWVFSFLPIESTGRINVAYKLSPAPDTLDGIITAWTEKGAAKYAYMTSTIIDGSETSQFLDIFITIKGSSRHYDYKFIDIPQTSAAFLRQANRLGAKGFRVKILLFNGTQQVFSYTRDRSRPSAKYTYRHLSCVSNVSDLIFQANQQAANGYRYISTLQIDNLCSVYIKDTSTKLKFIVETAPSFGNISAFIVAANSQGAEGYRFVDNNLILLKSGNTTNYARWSAFYRDVTQASCTYNYANFESPNTSALYLEQLDKQAAEGFIYLTSFLSFNRLRYTYYIKPNGCHYRDLGIDGLY